MYKGIVATDRFVLFHDEECLAVQFADEFGGLEAIAGCLSFTLTFRYFAPVDGEHLAEIKASELYETVSNYLPHQLSFELEDEQLERAINLAVCQNATRFFDEYCGQQLYIGTLHALLNTDQPRDGPV
jgi:hypothetical protein